MAALRPRIFDPREALVDVGDGEDDHEHRDRHSGRVPVLALEERLIEEEGAQHVRALARAAPGHDPDQVEHLQREDRL